MNIENINDVIFSLIEEKNVRDLEVNFKFIYNSYIENETQIEDNVIDFRDLNEFNIKKNRFIRINVENPVQFNFNRLESDVESEVVNNILVDFNNRDLYEEDRNFFNKVDNLSPDRKSLVLDNKFNDYRNYYKLYSSNNSNITESDFISYDQSRKISLKRIEEYENKFNNKNYVENFNFNNVNDYDKLVENESVRNERKSKDSQVEKFKKGQLLPNLKSISRSVNSGDIDDYSLKNGLFCGFYVEKFIKNNDKYDFKCARFYERKVNFKESINIIEDEAIRYGKTYRYVCYNTYFFTCADPDNRFVLNHYLMCTNPYISNDILCKEFKRPPAPTGFTANFSKKEDKIVLSWTHPTNYENDVKGYQILKRSKLDEPYTLIKQLEGHLKSDLYELTELIPEESIFKTPGLIYDYCLDETFNKNMISIYTIRSIDAHGMVSDYGEQIAVYYDFMRDELIVDLVAYTGSRIMYPNETLLNKSRFFENVADIVDNLPVVDRPRKISLYLTPDYGYVTSNDIEEKVYNNEYQFTFTNLNSLKYKSDKFTITNFG